MSETKQEHLNLSVVIITLNEQAHIKRCLESLPEGVEIVVLDSGSKDETRNIAESFGAKVFHRDFDHYANQKNAATQLASRRWVFSIDADEVMDESLKRAVTGAIKDPRSEQQRLGFKVRRRLVFLGRLMRYGKTRDFPVRLFLKDEAHFTEGIHERLNVPIASQKLLEGTLYHYSYDDLKDYFERFNTYTSRIAENHYAKGKRKPVSIFHAARPFFEFINRYILRLGFLDGYEGYCYALLSSLYAYVKYAKLREIYQKGSEL